MPKINEVHYVMQYAELVQHIGHKIEINEVLDWETNRMSSIEIRCTENDCEGCEPLVEIDNPDFKPKE